MRITRDDEWAMESMVTGTWTPTTAVSSDSPVLSRGQVLTICFCAHRAWHCDLPVESARQVHVLTETGLAALPDKQDFLTSMWFRVLVLKICPTLLFVSPVS